ARPPDLPADRPRRHRAGGGRRALAGAHARTGRGRRHRGSRSGRVVPRGAAVARRVPVQAADAVRPRRRGRRGRALGARRIGVRGGRPRRRDDDARRLCRGRRRTAVPDVRAARRARVRRGRRTRPQLPHGVLLARHARAPDRGRDRARPRRRGRRRDGDPAGGQGPRRADDRDRLERREGAGRARSRCRRGAALRRAVEGPGQGARRRGSRHRPGRRRPVHRQPAHPEGGGQARRRRLHRRLDPRGQGQPAPAQQHRDHRGRLGRVRDAQAAGEPRDRRGDRQARRVRARAPARRCAVPARAGRRGAQAHRLAWRDRQGRARDGRV
ncbi:MAG: FadB4, partial [uncultured Solirubrobacteraceae bacterium]